MNNIKDTGASPTDSVASVLLRRRGGDGVTVVPAEKYDGALKGGSKVEACVGITLTGCTLPKVADHNTVGVLPLDGVGGANSCLPKKTRGGKAQLRTLT